MFPQAVRPAKPKTSWLSGRCVFIVFWVLVAATFAAVAYWYSNDIIQGLGGPKAPSNLHAGGGGTPVQLERGPSTSGVGSDVGVTSAKAATEQPQHQTTPSETPKVQQSQLQAGAGIPVNSKPAVTQPTVFPSDDSWKQDTADPVAGKLKAIQAYARAIHSELFNQSYTVTGSKEGDYLPEHSNACYHDRNGIFRCLPGLLMLGGFHSGATALVHNLQKLNSTHTDASSGMQFWAEWDKMMEGYVNGFTSAAAAVKERPKDLIMDISQSTYAFYLASGAKAHRPLSLDINPCVEKCNTDFGTGTQEAWDACMETECMPHALEVDEQVAREHGMDYLKEQHLPMLIRAVYGNKIPKLVIMLRDPIARLHSAFYGYPHYYGKYGNHSEGFLNFVTESIDAFRECQVKFGDDKCAYLFEVLGVAQEQVYFHCDQLLRGMHPMWMKVWLRFFPRSSIMVIRADEYFNSRQEQSKVMKELIKFIGLPEPPAQELEKILDGSFKISWGANKEMLPLAKQKLVDFYGLYNTQLATLLKDPYYESWTAKWRGS